MPRHQPQLIPDAGPEFAPSGASGTGLYPGEVWRYQLGEAAHLVLPLPAWTPQPGSSLQIAVFPEWSGTGFDPCRLGLIAAGLDGSRSILLDQHGHPLDGELRCLVADQWNLLDLDLEPVAGRRLGRVELVLPAGSGRGWLQLLGVHPRPGEPEDVVTRAVTTRGSHSGYQFSRGNTYPAVCLPHGYVFATPVTDADTARWIYRWASDGPLPRLQALALSHQPSPWLGERNSAQVMPWFGQPQRSPTGRALEFDHRTEQAHPHNYRVRLRTADSGDHVQVELTPTQHGAAFRFRFAGPTGSRGVLFDQLGAADLRFNPLPDGRVGLAWWLPEPAGGSAPSAWVYGETMQPVQPWRPERRRWRARPAAQVPALVLPAGEVLEVRLSQSFISLAQARHNYELQMRAVSFDQLTGIAHDAWSAILGRLELTGGTAEQRTAAWSGLARLFSWPNAHHENLGSNQAPRWAYASPYRRRSRPDDAERGGLPVVPGRLLVNNGYWDTYRTAWPAYHLLMPRHASELLDGILQAYRDSGWMSRWSAPGHHDLMVGTSSDVIFADAAAHGIGFDQRTGYDSALRNALQPSTDPAVGRRQLARARFVGWVDRSTRESVSWSMENANCDAALALWSGRLAGSDPARRPEYLANAAYFTNRALAWTALFDPRTGFIRGRDQGGFGTSFDPLAWGGDYTETNAWGMAFAPVWDGAGLASCLGGEDALAARLDQARATPETASRVGSYRAVIHEMVEARALRLGQLGVNNQPAHHIPYMYLHAGRPDATQALVAEICDRIFVGSEIGQGYPRRRGQRRDVGLATVRDDRAVPAAGRLRPVRAQHPGLRQGRLAPRRWHHAADHRQRCRPVHRGGPDQRRTLASGLGRRRHPAR